ncbi:MAG: hypothetical protein ACFFFO_06210, partial [Candidatus Thorarchaeota archaeon]
TDRDSVSYIKFLRICKKHLQWIGLSEAARDILSVLLTEYYWSSEALSPEELASITGYSRGSISVAISQLRSLGFIETRVDTTQEGRGRRPTLYALSEGLSGLIMFGIRRLGVELEGILNETNAMQMSTDRDEKIAVEALAKLTREAKRNSEQLREYTRVILSTKMLEESSPGQESD